MDVGDVPARVNDGVTEPANTNALALLKISSRVMALHF